MEIALIAVLSAVAGFVAGRSHMQGRHAAEVGRLESLAKQVADHESMRDTYERDLRELGEEAAGLRATLDHERKAFAERSADDGRLLSEFEKLSKLALEDARKQLEKSAESSLKLANEAARSEFDKQRLGIEHLVKPVNENLSKLEEYVQRSDDARNEQFGGLFKQMQSVAETNERIQREAASLKNVLRSSSAQRGRWGEVQLRRVVDVAGMSEHCDFVEQSHVAHEDGAARADLVANLPDNVKVPVDAKVPFDAYERAQSADDEAARTVAFTEHAKAVRSHVDALSKKKYCDKYLPTCGFTVLFVPGDALLDAALLQDPKLWEYAVSKDILLATPSTLIAMLRMAALGWRQRAQAENADEILKIGRDLHKRLSTMGSHIDKLGKNLNQAVKSYNGFVGSIERNVLPQTRKFSELEVGGDSIGELTEITEHSRSPRAELFPRKYSDESYDDTHWASGQ